MAVETSFLDILTRYVLPPVLGGGAGFFTVYANWGIEKQRQRLTQRKEHIASWRNELLPLLPPNTGWAGPLTAQVMASPAFASLEPHLSPELLKKMRDERTWSLRPIRRLVELGLKAKGTNLARWLG